MAPGKESACNAGDLSLIPGLGRSPGERKDYPLQYSGLENSVGYIVHGVTKSQTSDRLSLSFSISLFFCGAHLGISSNLLSRSSALSSSTSDCYLTYIFQVLV